MRAAEGMSVSAGTAGEFVEPSRAQRCSQFARLVTDRYVLALV